MADITLLKIPAGFLAVALCLMPVGPSRAGENVVIDYSGKLRVSGTNYSGLGNFIFLIQNAEGEILWNWGGLPMPGSKDNAPDTARVPVRDGVYSVRLGDISMGMAPLDAAILAGTKNPRLKVWFNDGVHGWNQAGGDVVLDRVSVEAGELSKRPMTVAQGDAILRELRELRAEMGRQKAAGQPQPQPEPPKVATVSLVDAPSLGKEDATVVLVEFTDYQCPYCKQFHDLVYSGLKSKYIDTGRVRFVSRNLPLPFHANAGPAAEAALCAGRQSKFWEMREKLFSNPLATTAEGILRAAGEIQLDLTQFNGCIAGKTFEARLKKEAEEIAPTGIVATPSFVIGKASGAKVTGTVIVGAQPAAVFEAEIERLLGAH